MTETEYKTEMAKLQSDFDEAKKQLMAKFAFENAKFKKGDIIADSVNTILIDRITAYSAFSLPEAVYNGVSLKKDLTPRKDGSRASIYGSNHITLIK